MNYKKGELKYNCGVRGDNGTCIIKSDSFIENNGIDFIEFYRVKKRINRAACFGTFLSDFIELINN